MGVEIDPMVSLLVARVSRLVAVALTADVLRSPMESTMFAETDCPADRLAFSGVTKFTSGEVGSTKTL